MESAEGGVELDVTNLTVSDIRQLDNPVLREVLLKVKQQIEAEATGSEGLTEHTVHAEHYQNLFS